MSKNSSYFEEVDFLSVKNRLSLALKSYTEEAEKNVKKGYERAFIVNNRSVCLLRAEELELVVVGFVGCIDDVLFINARAKELNFKTARIHCFRAGMLKKLRSLGLDFNEIEQRQNPDFMGKELVLRMEF